MKELKVLAQIMTDEMQQPLPLISLKSKPGKELTYLKGIIEGTFENDEQAAVAIYGTSASDFRYLTLKKRLKRKLLNNLFFVDFTKLGNHPASAPELECLRLFHIIKVLSKKGCMEYAEKLASKLVDLATKAGFNSFVLSALEELQHIYVQLHKPLLYQKNLEKLQRYWQLLQYEREANNLYLGMKLRLNQSVKHRQSLLPEVASAVERLRELWQLTQSFNVFEHYYILRIWHLELVNNFEEIIQLTDEAEGLRREGIIYEQCFDHRYNRFIKVYACLRTKQYEAGLQYAETYIESFNESDWNWFPFMENYVLLALHQKNYELAQQLLINVLLNPKQSQLVPLEKERWMLYRAYLHFLLPPQQADRKFDFNGLISQLPHYRKDKAGFNVAILVLQFLYFMKKQDLDSLLYRVNALNEYMVKHLSSSFSDRTRTLFKLFRALTSNYNLDPVQMRRRCQYLAGKLASLPTEGDAYAEIEIIPYEHVWELCLQWLPEREKRVTSN
jgi:hypothetical protein